MAQKRGSPLDEPPAASSSGEEEEAASSEEEEDSSEDEEEQEDQPAKKAPPSSTISRPQASSSESVPESDSEDERPASNVDPIVKPSASKPMEETPKVKKPRSQPSATAARSATKRPSENNRLVSDSKRAKKKVIGDAADGEIPVVGDDSKKSGDDSKKLFQRLWSEDDEIVILKGIIEYSAKNGADPVKDINAFHDFIKESLHCDFSKDQLYNKIRRLKSKYTAGKGKNGVDPNFSKPHDKKAFELAKKIWATEASSGGGGAQWKSPGKVKKSQNEGDKILASPRPEAELHSRDSKEATKVDIDQNSVPSLSLSEMSWCERSIGLIGLNEDVVKTGLKLIGSSKRAELEKRWKELQIAELELYVKRSELIKDQSKLILEAYKSSNH